MATSPATSIPAITARKCGGGRDGTPNELRVTVCSLACEQPGTGHEQPAATGKRHRRFVPTGVPGSSPLLPPIGVVETLRRAASETARSLVSGMGPSSTKQALSAEQTGERLRERIYGTIALLASLVTLLDHDGEATAGGTAVTLIVTVVALWMASVFADVTAHLASHNAFHRAEIMPVLASRREMLVVAVLPLLLLAGAGLDWWQLSTALRWSVAAQVTILGLVGLLAVRGSTMSRALKLLVVSAEVSLGFVVVAVKLAAH